MLPITLSNEYLWVNSIQTNIVVVTYPSLYMGDYNRPHTKQPLQMDNLTIILLYLLGVTRMDHCSNSNDGGVSGLVGVAWPLTSIHTGIPCFLR